MNKIYRDEPLPIAEARVARQIPTEYKQMRRIAIKDFENISNPETFYKQARFMEKFEDEFEYREEFDSYYPTYQAMNDRQLRTYFSWRTQIRRGIIKKMPLSFALVYLYELIHCIGSHTAEEGFSALRNFWLAYRKIDARIDPYVSVWLNDYVIYYNLDNSLLGELSYEHGDGNALILLNYQHHSVDELFDAMSAISTYRLNESKFFKLYPDDVKEVAYNVFAAFFAEYGNKFFGGLYSNAYTMFRSAVFYDFEPQEDRVYKINEVYAYQHAHRNGRMYWRTERFFGYSGKDQSMGAILKTIDSLMRQKYEFKSTLKPGILAKKDHDIIVRVLEKFLEDKRKAALPDIKIDVSKLHGIRKAAQETQNRLLVEEDWMVGTQDGLASVGRDAPGAPRDPTTPPYGHPSAGFLSSRGLTTGSSINYSGLRVKPAMTLGSLRRGGSLRQQDDGVVGVGQDDLSAPELALLHSLLYGGEITLPPGTMPAVLADSINAKLSDRFGDIVLTEDGGTVTIIEDYVDDLKGIIR